MELKWSRNVIKLFKKKTFLPATDMENSNFEIQRFGDNTS